MADKELRRMNRTELIEIIYALQQNEQVLRRENEDLTSQLEDRTIRLDQSGSIAEAALSLNRVFENAQAAADQYLASIRDVHDREEEILLEARKQAEQILEDAKRQAENLIAEAKTEADADIAQERDRFVMDASQFLKRNPEIAKNYAAGAENSDSQGKN